MTIERDLDRGAVMQDSGAEQRRRAVIYIFTPDDLPGLLTEANAGNERAAHILQVTYNLVSSIRTGSTSDQHRCASCARQLSRKTPFSLVMIEDRAGTEGNGIAIAIAICTYCAISRRNVQAKAVVMLGKAFPGLREISLARGSELYH